MSLRFLLILVGKFLIVFGISFEYYIIYYIAYKYLVSTRMTTILRQKKCKNIKLLFNSIK